MKVALVGIGGLGGIVADHLRRDDNIEFVCVAAREHQKERVRGFLGDVPVVGTPDALLACKPDLVVECASHEAFRAYAAPVLAAGVDLIAVSVGVLAETALREQVLSVAAASGASLQIPAGAIGAIDVVAAARHAGLTRVTYVTRKSPKTWGGTPAEKMIDLKAVREPVLFFDDDAERAALVFTEKANVTATLALAGVGFKQTRVHFWADPAVNRSMHHIEVEGAFGTMTLDLANNVSPTDGRASLLTAVSIVQAVRNRQAVLRL
jgi:aspartate dehydrogenase